MNFFSNDVEIVLTMTFISVLVVFLYNLIKNIGSLHLNILNIKVTIQNKNTWNEEANEINENTKGIDIDFILDIYNNRNNYNSISEINVYKKQNLKFYLIENNNLNLNDTVKSVSGSSVYEKLKYASFHPYELKEFNIKIKLTKEEFLSIEKEPIYIIYKERLQTKKILLNDYLKRKK